MWRWATLWVLGTVWSMAACGSSSHSPASGGQAGSAGTANTGGSAGQGTSGSSSAAGAAAPIPLADLCPVFTHDLCVYLMECGGARYKDAEHCENELDCFGLPQLTAAAEAGAVDYDPSKVGACHERFLESPCTFGFFLFTPDIYDVLAYCPGTVVPKLQAGDSCASNGECSEGLYCYKGTDYQCPGQCQAFGLEGEDCAGSGRCADGLDCEADVCVPEAKAGDNCDLGCNYSLSCPEDEVCPGNIWCNRETSLCEPGRLEGEACGSFGVSPTTYTASCAVHLWCDAPVFGEGTCQKPSGEGGPCNDDFQACQDDLHCVGYVFAVDSPTLGSCEPPAAVNGECRSGNDCQEGLSCVLGVCAEPGGEGATCGDSDACRAGFVCVAQLCEPVRYPGDPCDGTRCTFGRCVEGVCGYHIKVGGACTAPTDCATGECIDGLCYDDSVCNAPEP